MKTSILKKAMCIAFIATFLISWNISSQTVIFSETCGADGATANPRPTPATYESWDNKAPVTFDGNTDIRQTSSLDSHVWFAAENTSNPGLERNLIISGINTAGKTDLKLSFAITCNKAGANANALFIKVKDMANGGDETTITVPSTEIATQNKYTTVSNLAGLPATSNLQITFFTTAASNPNGFGFRLDDIQITSGDAPVLSTNNDLASLTIDGTAMENFDPATTSYAIVLPEGTITVPTVAYTLADSKAEAVKTDAAQIPGTTTIEVTAENGDKKTYSVNFSLTTPAGTWIEDFETETTKGSYAVGDYQGNAALWEVFGVVRNDDDNDKKNGKASARLRDPRAADQDNHYILMKEDKADGAGIISLYHGMYGNHTGGTYKLEVSNDGGTTWEAFTEEVTEVPGNLTQKTFTANVEGNIRIKITKTSEGTNSINIDDIQISNYTGTSINNIANNLYVYSANGTLYIKNLNEATTINVYDLSGRLVTKTTATEIPLTNSGVYIVKVGGANFKVISNKF